MIFSPAGPATAEEIGCDVVAISPDALNALNESNCDPAGTPVTLSDGSVLIVPEAGHGISMSNARPVGESGIEEAQLISDPHGQVALVVDGTTFGSLQAVEYFDSGVSTLASPSVGCSNSSYALSGRRWATSTYSWWYNPSGQVVPGQTRISAGISTIAGGLTRCGTTVVNSATAIYNGATTAAVSVTASGCTGVNDGKSTVGWKSLGSATLARTFTNYILGAILDADIAFDTADPWYNGASTTSCTGNLYDLQQIATQEAGHAYGLDHVAQTTEQIMKPSFGYCETTGRNLGLGDAAGMKVLYV